MLFHAGARVSAGSSTTSTTAFAPTADGGKSAGSRSTPPRWKEWRPCAPFWKKRPSGSGASARSAGAVHPPGGALRGGGQGVCTLPQPPGGPRPLRGHADGPHGAVQRRGRCTGRPQRTAGPSREAGALQVWPGVGAVRSAGDAAAGMCCDAGRFGPHPGGGDAAPAPASMKRAGRSGRGGGAHRAAAASSRRRYSPARG